MRRVDRTKVLGFDLTVQPTVFHPQLFYSSKLLGSYVCGLPLGGLRVLDMGTGSGIVGLCAAKVGASVLSVDINPAALSCAEANALQNDLRSSIEYHESDLFSNIDSSSRFDYIIWNPPFYPTQPYSDEEQAWKAGSSYAAINRFAANVRKFLRLGGKVLLVLSTDQDLRMIEAFFLNEGFTHTKVADKRTLFETLTVYRFE